VLSKISVVILTKNSSKYIKQVLHSVRAFDEVLVLDNGSTDETMEIARTFDNAVVHEHEFIGFGPLKSYAASLAKNEWILSLDSDEILTEALIDALREKKLDPKTVYTVERVNYYKEKKIEYCWNHDIIIRLYNKKRTGFNDKYVHEGIEANGLNVELLHGSIKHYSYSSISEFMIKADRYSTLFAEQNAGKQSSSPMKAVSHALFAFVKTYMLKRGFLDGYIGLIISSTQAFEKFYKYMKLYERNVELENDA
jgi:glycosyltransferase involved in cell wall biosynthesis